MLDQTTPMPAETTSDDQKARPIPDTAAESDAKPSAPRLPAYVMHG